MDLIFVLLAGVFVYLWNRYAVPFGINFIVRQSLSYKQNTRLVKKQRRVVRIIQGFYWLCFVVFLLLVVFGEFKT